MKIQEARQRILIVENDQDTRFLLERALSAAGYAVETCNAGVPLVEFRYPVPDLFILDRELPTIDGIAVTKFLRLQETTKTTPIIMISGYGAKRKAKQAGIDEFIRKPFPMTDLLRVVEKYIRQPREFQSAS